MLSESVESWCIERTSSCESMLPVTSELALPSSLVSASRHSWNGSGINEVATAVLSGLRRSGELGLLLVVELLLRELADRRLRQLGANVERMHHLVLAELVLQECLQLGERERRSAGLELDEGLRRLAAVLVVDADHGDLGDRGVLVDRVLEIARVHVEAAAQ